MVKMPRKTKKEKRNDYIKDLKKELYDQILLQVPKGTKDRLKEVSASMDISVNEYINRLIKADLEQDHKPDDLHTMLRRWQVKDKYHPFIQSASHTPTTGYFIKLKKGYINDYSGSDEIIVDKTDTLKHIMQFTHPVRTPEEMCGLDSKTYEQLIRWQMPKSYIPLVESIEDHAIHLKDGRTLEFKSVSELRYLWKTI